MKYEEFMKITDKWSDNDKLRFLMEYPVYHKLIMQFLLHNWRDSVVVDFEEIRAFAKTNDILTITDLTEEE